jgi:hypothetical protein
MVIENGSEVTVGDGSLASTANFLDNSGTALTIKDNSLLKVANQNNYYSNWGQYTYTPTSGSSTNFTTTGLDLNCGSGYVHSTSSCNSNSQYVYGCATLNSNGAVACIPLAFADIDLSAKSSGPGRVDLNWTDNETTPADHYLVQRAAGNDNFATIGTVSAGGYTAGDYHFTDGDAPASTDNYRIARVAANGSILYSPVNSVTLSAANAGVGIHPNPVIGGTIFITTPFTSATIVNIYTLTGQLLLRTSLQGQTQYAVHLPSEALSLNAAIVQTIGQAGNQSFTVLIHP